MAWAVCNELDEVFIFLAIFPWFRLVKEFTDFVDNLQVVSFVVSTDVVGFSAFTLVVDEVDGFAVIQYIEPVPDVGACAIDGDGFFCKTFADDGRDEFLSMLLGSIVVGAVASGDVHAVGVVVCPDDVVG